MELFNKYKKIVYISLLSIVIVFSFNYSINTVKASFNKQINYQGKLFNSSNSAVTDGNYNIRYNLYTTSSGGSPVWTETLCYSADNGATCSGSGVDSRVSVTSGLFSTLLGNITSLDTVNFDQTLYLGVEIGGTGSTPSWDGEMTPRKKLGAVPASFESDKLDGISSEQFLRADANNSTTTSNTFFNLTQNGAGKIAEFFGQGASSVMSILSNGNVGIGTTSPGQMLSVAGDILGNKIIGSSFNATSSVASVLPYASTTAISATTICFTGDTCRTFWPSGSGGAAGTWSTTTSQVSGQFVNYSNNNTDVIAIGANSTTSSAFWFDPNTTTGYVSGKLGIGTTTPGQGLSVAGDILGNKIIGSSFNATSSVASVFPYASSTAISSGNAWFTGNVGIGTTTPRFLLDIESSAGTQARLIGDGTSGAGLVISRSQTPTALGDRLGGLFFGMPNGSSNFNSAAINAYASGAWTTSSDIGSYITFETTASGSTTRTEKLRIDNNGNIGIGTTTPGQRLSVAGDILGNNIIGSYFNATSTSIASIFPFASTTAITASSSLAVGTTTVSHTVDIVDTLNTEFPMSFYTYNGTRSGDIFIGTDASRQIGFNTASATGANSRTDGWVLFRFNSSSNKMSFGDTGTESWIQSNHNLNFAVGSIANASTTPNMTLTSTGLGIGSTTPYSILSISNSRNTPGNTPLLTIASTTDGIATSTFLTVLANGNTGFGTTTPGQKISVAGDILGNNIIGSRFNATSSIASVFPYASTTAISANTICFTGDTCRTFWPTGSASTGTWSTTTSQVLGQFVNYSNNNTDVIAIGANSTTSSAFWFDPNITTGYISGKLGIGTTSPGQHLSVSGDILGNNIIGSYFSATSTSVASVFPYASSTAISAGTICFTGDTCRTTWPTGGGSAFPFTTTTFGSTDANSTSTLIGFTAGIYSLASSTIGDGSQIGGLTISGGATTTLNAYFGSNVGIGTTTPGQRLSVAGDILGNNIIGSYFNATSTSIASVFPYASTTVVSSSGSAYFATSGGLVGIGTTTPAGVLEVVKNASNALIYSTVYSATAQGFQAGIVGRKAAGSSASPLPTLTDSNLLALSGRGYTGTDFSSTANGLITIRTQEQFSSTNMGTGITFETTASGSTNRIETARITGEGNLLLGTTTQDGRIVVVATSSVTNLNLLSLQSPTPLGLATSSVFLVNAYGNLGIGTTTPGQKISVAGDILGNNIIGSYFNATSSIASVFPYASSTAQTISGTLYLDNLNGPLQANNGVVSATTSIGVLYGGTGLSSYTPGDLLYASGASTLAGTSTANLKASLALNNVENTAISTWSGSSNITTLGTITSGTWNGNTIGVANGGTGATSYGQGWIYSNGGTGALSASTSPTVAYLVATSSIASILPYASTTVFTSSGNSYFATSGGSVGIGTTSPIAKLSINPIAGDQASFIIGSSTATKFIVNASGYVGIGTSSPNSPLSISAGSSGYTPSGVLFAENNGSAAASYVAQFSSGSATGNSYPTFNLTNSGSTILNSQSSFLGYGTNVSIVGSGGSGRGQLVITNGASATNWFNIFVDSSANANLSANGPVRVFRTQGGTSDIFNIASSTGGLATSTYLTVSGIGNFGIGTTTPGQRLSVAGDILGNNIIGSYFNATSTSVASVLPYASTTALSAGTICLTGDICRTTWGSGSSYDWNKQTNYGVLSLTPTTTIPVWFKDQVFASSSAIFAGDVTSNRFISTSTSLASIFPYASTTVISSTGNAYFATSGGSVGIGTTSPYATLGVNGLIAGSRFNADDASATSTLLGGLSVAGSQLNVDFSTGITSVSSLEAGPMNFDTDAGMVTWTDLQLASASNNSVQGYSAMLNGSTTIMVYGVSAGSGWLQNDYPRVAIGSSTAPSSKLTVYGNGTGTNGIFEIANSASTTLYKMFDNGIAGMASTSPWATFAINPLAGVASNQFVIGSSTATNFIVNNSGLVGLATTSPWRTLSVVGTAAFNGLTSSATGNAVCITASKELTDAGGASCTPSSIRFKENVNPLPEGYALSELAKLGIVSFDYINKDQFETNHSYGMIAEEVEKIDKNLVDYGYDGKPISLHFEKITGLLVQAVQEQQKQINDLKNASTTLSNLSVNSSSINFPSPQNSISEEQIRAIASSTAMAIVTSELRDAYNLDMIASSTEARLVSSNSFVEKMTLAIKNYVKTSTDWAFDKLTVKTGLYEEITANKTTTKELCIEDVCVSKNELKALLDNAHINSISTINSINQNSTNIINQNNNLNTVSTTSTEAIIQASSSTPVVEQNTSNTNTNSSNINTTQNTSNTSEVSNTNPTSIQTSQVSEQSQTTSTISSTPSTPSTTETNTSSSPSINTATQDTGSVVSSTPDSTQSSTPSSGDNGSGVNSGN